LKSGDKNEIDVIPAKLARRKKEVKKEEKKEPKPKGTEILTKK